MAGLALLSPPRITSARRQNETRRDGGFPKACWGRVANRRQSIDLTMFSTIFLASPNSIIVFGL